MNSRQLSFLLCVAKNRSIKKAAAELMVSEQAVSKTIKDLELTLNTSIFLRSTSGLILTETGKKACVSAQKIMDEMDIMMSLEEDRVLPKQAITLYAPENFFEYLGSDFPAKFLALQNQFILNLMNAPESFILDMLRSDQLDMGILHSPENNSVYHNELLFEDHYCAVMSKNHPLAQKPCITLEDLASFPFVTNGRSYPLYLEKQKSFRKRNITLQPVIESNNIYYLLEAAKDHQTIGLILSSLAKRHADTHLLKIVSIEEPAVYSYYLCYKKQVSLKKEQLALIRMLHHEAIAAQRVRG